MRLKISLITLLFALIFSSCVKDEPNIKDPNLDRKISLSSNEFRVEGFTKATLTDEKATFGVYAHLGTGSFTGSFIVNAPITKSGTVWDYADDTDIRYWHTEKSIDFVAYFPHKEASMDGNNVKVTYSSVGSNGFDDVMSDVISDATQASPSGANSSATATSFKFVRALSKVETFVKHADYNAQSVNKINVTSIKLRSVSTSGDLIIDQENDLSQWVPSTIKGDILLNNENIIINEATSISAASTITSPNPVNAFYEITYTDITGGQQVKNINIPDSWVAGMSYSYTIVISNDNVTIGDVTISDWIAGGTMTDGETISSTITPRLPSIYKIVSKYIDEVTYSHMVTVPDTYTWVANLVNITGNGVTINGSRTVRGNSGDSFDIIIAPRVTYTGKLTVTLLDKNGRIAEVITESLIQVTAPEFYSYPNIRMTDGSIFIVYDRNAGMSVPQNVYAENWVNGLNIGDVGFKGDYYTWDSFYPNATTEVSPCFDAANGWRLPSEPEMRTLSSRIRYNATANAQILTGVNESTCYFPLSGSDENPNETTGSYWTSTADNRNMTKAHTLYVTSGGSLTMSNDTKDNALTVRCVKTVVPALPYPIVQITSNLTYDIYVYDRNAGIHVPQTGVAGNWVNNGITGTGQLDFKGDYYSWQEAMNNKNTNDVPTCPNGWRLPTETEMKKIGSQLTYTGDSPKLTSRINGISCNFSLSGSLLEEHGVHGYFWTSTARQAESVALYVSSSSHTVSTYRKTNEYSVRCVKTIE